MHHETRPRRPWRAAIAAAAMAAVALGSVAGLALALDLRREVTRTGAPLARAADGLARTVDPGRTAATRTALAGSGADARLIGPAGRVRVQTGDAPGVWDAGGAAWPGALATASASGWTLRDGVIEARRALPGGGAVVLRQALRPGAGTLGASAVPVGVAIAGLALIAGLAAWGIGARSARRLHDAATALESIAAGRSAGPLPAGRGGWGRLGAATDAVCDRAVDLRAAAEARMDALGAAIAPLAHPVAARTPSGGLIRNDALERLVAGLAPADGAQVDDAVRIGLSASGPVARGLSLSDGRTLEVEAWSVPGGRVVAVGERTEQARLATMRRQVTGSAARHLQAPISEIQALASDLTGQVPPTAQASVRRITVAGDRMERLVGRMLRGTADDPRARPLQMRPVGAAGLAYGLGAAVDRRLRDRGLRLETDLPSDLPPLRTDAALTHEILTELIANAATFTPRGGTITLSGRALPGGRVALTVSDTGPGMRGDELHLVTERFARGSGSSGFPGAGLGLGVAAALAERLGGNLTLGAGPGGQARLELPASHAAPGVVPPPAELTVAAAAPAP